MPVSKPTRPKTLEEACGRIIAAAREKHGLSQMDLAVASGYSLRYIGDVERGAKSATLRTMNDLATLLNVRLASLIAEAEDTLGTRGKVPKTPIGNRGSRTRRTAN